MYLGKIAKLTVKPDLSINKKLLFATFFSALCTPLTLKQPYARIGIDSNHHDRKNKGDQHVILFCLVVRSYIIK